MRRSRKRLNADRRSVIEGLEHRQLLAAAPPVVTATVAADGMLDVVGTRRSDVIVVQLDPANAQQLIVTAAGVAVGQPFPLTSVTSIRVNGGGGSDDITIGDTVTVPATVIGDR